MSQPRLFLLDAMALIFRAHYAFANNPRVTSRGLNTSAIYGFTNTLLEILQKEQPTHLAVAFESTVPTFRHEVFPEYKGHREETPEAISMAVPYIFRMLEALQIPALYVDRYEADDVIGTLACRAAEAGFQVYMVTPDKDYAQLVTSAVRLYRPGKSSAPAEIYDPERVKEKYGVAPERITDLLGMMGDAVDNIPGIKGVGEKTALKLLKEYGSLEATLEAAAGIKQKALRQKLLDGADLARQSRELATIHTDIPLTFEPEQMAVRAIEADRIRPIFQELEFRSLAKRLLGEEVPTNRNPGQQLLYPESDSTAPEAITTDEKAPDTADYRLLTMEDVAHEYMLCDTPEKQAELLAQLSQQPRFCFDTETTSLDAMQAELVGLAFSFYPHTGYYIPLPEDRNQTLEILAPFRPLLENPATEKIGQNIKYDLLVMARYGIEVRGPLFDTMLAQYVCHSNQARNMDSMARQYLNYDPVPISDLIGPKGKKQLSMRDVPLEKVVKYAAEDADITFQLREKLAAEMQELEMRRLFDEVEMPLVPVLARMERNGICIDRDFLEAYANELDKDLQNLDRQVRDLSGQDFNLNSPRQLGEILFDKLRLKDKPRKTATGQYATDERTLSELAAQGHELPARVLDYRELAKLKSTYVDALPKLIHPETRRVHTSFNQAVAVTGRLSSNNPNIQNIPIRTDRGREVRKAFVARSGDWILLSADYSQIELRIMAALSGDEAMLSAFRNGEDIHRATAARVFGLASDEVQADHRRQAKTINFGLIYGITAFGLASRLGVSRSEAQDIIDQYFSQYPGISQFMENCREQARTHGYAETMLGRRHYLPDIHSRNNTTRGFAERNAINTPIQGTAAEMIKLAMIRIDQRMQDVGFRAVMMLQVHDELLFEVPHEELEALQTLVVEEMQQALPLEVPIEVNTGTGPNWLDAH